MFTVKLTINELNAIISFLKKHPYEDVVNLIDTLRNQAMNNIGEGKTFSEFINNSDTN